MYRLFHLWILTTLLLVGCDSPEHIPFAPDLIPGRSGENVWQIRRPLEWLPKPTEESLQDTRVPNKEYVIDGNISVFIHSFPSRTIEERIPPGAQVQRWKAQFDQTPLPTFHLSPQAFSGYSGYLLEGRGCIKGKNTRMLAWALSLPPKSYFSLKNPETQSDITIKIVGDEDSVDIHEETIRRSARTFELLEAIL